MDRSALLEYLSALILGIQKNAPVLVGIDGVDASGKSTFADELTIELRRGDREIIRASIDDFHNPEEVRYVRGKDSPEGYYFDSFNYDALIEFLLMPLSKGDRNYRSKVFDYRINEAVIQSEKVAKENSILIMEGVFLFRPEIVHYWDLKIFLDVDFSITVERAIQRASDQLRIGSEDAIQCKYDKRYIPGQQLYFEQALPNKIADIVIDNSDFQNPLIVQEK